jgi:hypothetical protein
MMVMSTVDVALDMYVTSMMVMSTVDVALDIYVTSMMSR